MQTVLKYSSPPGPETTDILNCCHFRRDDPIVLQLRAYSALLCSLSGVPLIRMSNDPFCSTARTCHRWMLSHLNTREEEYFLPRFPFLSFPWVHFSHKRLNLSGWQLHSPFCSETNWKYLPLFPLPIIGFYTAEKMCLTKISRY